MATYREAAKHFGMAVAGLKRHLNMATYRVDYKVWREGNKQYETEHDIEAQSARAALLSFLGESHLFLGGETEPAEDYGLTVEADGLGELRDGLTVGEVVDLFLSRDGAQLVHECDDRIEINQVRLEDTRTCSACDGRGRTQTEA